MYLVFHQLWFSVRFNNLVCCTELLIRGACPAYSCDLLNTDVVSTDNTQVALAPGTSLCVPAQQL